MHRRRHKIHRNRKVQTLRVDDLEIELDAAVAYIKQHGAEVVGILLPEGLKRSARPMAELLERRTGCTVIVSGEACYGACDIDLALLDCVDLLVLVGHSKLLSLERVVYVEARSVLDVLPAVRSAAPLLEGKRVGIITTVQHVHKLDGVCELLSSLGFLPVAGEGDARVCYRGQVLGCNFSAARCGCDELLYVGGGQFHPLGAALATGMRVVVADPYMGEGGEARVIDTSTIIKQRYAAIWRAFDARTFGVVMCSKPGQKRPERAKQAMSLIRESGKEAILITMNDITPAKLDQFGMDCFVLCACPRVVIDEYSAFSVPVLTFPELEIVLGRRGMDELVFDEIVEG